MDGEPREARLRTYELFRAPWEIRVLVVPTVGVLATVLLGLVPLALFPYLLDQLGTLGFALSLLIWLGVAAGLAVGSFMLGRRVASMRMHSGSVALGEDGISVRRMFAKRFYPWSEVRQARCDGPVVVLDVAGGKTDRLLLADPVAFESHAQRAKARFERAERAQRLRVLDCDGAPDRSWLERVRAAASEQAYRDEELNAERLVRVVEDMSQSPDQRVGAALALAGASTEIVRRVRVAAECTANPEVAAALEQALEGELDLRGARRAIHSKS